MKPEILPACALLLAGVISTGSLSAHHSVRMFETTTPIRVKGTVVGYLWANPHSAIIVEQKDRGKTIRWALESSAPIRVLESRGFKKDSFRPGEVIEACGFAPQSALRPGTELSKQDDSSAGPVWQDDADRVITARLLLTRDGPKVHWSHYGPLELCISEAQLQGAR